MVAKLGDYLGSVRDLTTLRERCVVDEHGCWHLRTARGRPMPRDKRHQIHVYGHASRMSATRAAWQFAGNPAPGPGEVVARTCASYDCVNPDHLTVRTRPEQMQITQERLGPIWHTLHRIGTTRAVQTKHPSRKLTQEIAREIRRSKEPCSVLAERFGIAKSRAIAIKAGRAWREVD